MVSKLAGIGEILWDVLPEGRRLGGAPANFTCHARSLGADARLISRVGNDALGREACHCLAVLGVPVDCIEVDAALPTGTVTVEVAPDGQPQYQIHENVAWDALHGGPDANQAVAVADAVCFGTLAQRSEPSRLVIRSLVSASPSSALRILDVNLRQHFFSAQLIDESLRLANILKVNDAELPRLAEMFRLAGDERAQMTELARRYHLRLIACTRGANGSLLFADGSWSDHPGIRVKIVDSIGAGDSFTAAMTLGVLAKWDLDRINENANRVASYVCSRAGATPELPEELRELFHATPPGAPRAVR